MTSISCTLPHPHRDIWCRSWQYTKENLNFYRVHVLFFTFTPLIAAALFYASNGKTHIAFVDALFVCVSSMTVTGLATIDLSSLTTWQQVILLFLMCIGSPVTVSWFIVYVRRHFFAKKFEHIIESRISAFGTSSQVPLMSSWSTFWRKFTQQWRKFPSAQKPERVNDLNGSRVRADMIRRVDGVPQPVDPSGWVESPSEVEEDGAQPPKARQHRQFSSSGVLPAHNALVITDRDPTDNPDTLCTNPHATHSTQPEPPRRRRSSTGDYIRHVPPHVSGFRSNESGGIDRDHPIAPFPAPNRDWDRHFPRTQTIEFAVPTLDQMHMYHRNPSHGGTRLHSRRASHGGSVREASPFTTRHPRGSFREVDATDMSRGRLYSENGGHRTPLGRTATMQSTRSPILATRVSAKDEGFGGFPLPHVIIARLLRKVFPRLQHRLTRTVTMPYTTTVHSQRAGQTTVLGAKPVEYISFDAIVGRNSAFHALTQENIDELGGVEYKALNMLLWIVGLYNVCIPLSVFIIIGPYISQSRWRHVFYPPMQHRFVAPVWYSLFQVVSAYTNTGTSLVDQSMVPFQKAYAAVLSLPFLILAGNTAFPIFLRFVIWLLSKAVKKTSQAHETLHFLLDHPRRCFIYLFQSHQTWFLLTVLVLINFTDWAFFLILDIGNPAVSSIPIGTRFAAGFLQATAVRSAGFSVVTLSALAPAVKVLYVVMMYVSVYPIAMSIRSTNVYEERSLGVFDDDISQDAEEAALRERSRVRIWGRYLAAHARKQLSFDMWWLASALFLVCIVEQANLENRSQAAWFNIFAIIFEITSAYGTVGLSLGTPNANYSFSGAFKPLSKLIMCAVMLRGRHRGLPVAIDRAVLLPSELEKEDEVILTRLDEGIIEEFRSSDKEPSEEDVHNYAGPETVKGDDNAAVESQTT